MKQLKLLLLVVAVSSFHAAFGQMLPRHVCSAGGGNFETPALHASWTIGQSEPLLTVYQPGLILCNGFQQYVDIPVTIKEYTHEAGTTVFPNPCRELFCLDLNVPGKCSISYSLFNVNGQEIISGSIKDHDGTSKRVISMAGQPEGIYSLLVKLRKDRQEQVEMHKIIKN